MVFLKLWLGTWAIFSIYGRDDPSRLMFVQRRQDSSLVTRETSGITSRLGRAIRTLLEERQETEAPFLVAKLILDLLSICNKSQASSPFEALNSTWLSRGKRDVRHTAQIGGGGHRAFSRVSTGYSDIPSSCEMKDEPEFKPLQGNPTFF